MNKHNLLSIDQYLVLTNTMVNLCNKFGEPRFTRYKDREGPKILENAKMVILL